MSDVSELIFDVIDEDPEAFNTLLFGPPGSGKTTAAATAPGPILWLNAQGPGAFAPARREAARRGTPIMRVTIPRRNGDVVQIVRDTLLYWKRGREPRPRTIVVDTIGDLRARLAQQLVVGPQSKTREQWGEVAKILRDFVIELRDEPVNVVLIAHEVIEDADDDRIVRPKIGGASTEDIMGEMDVIAYCGVLRDLETNERQYHGQFVEVRGRRAKDRSGGLGEHRRMDLSEWLETYTAALLPDDSDLPFDATETPMPVVSGPSINDVIDQQRVTSLTTPVAVVTEPLPGTIRTTVRNGSALGYGERNLLAEAPQPVPPEQPVVTPAPVPAGPPEPAQVPVVPSEPIEVPQPAPPANPAPVPVEDLADAAADAALYEDARRLTPGAGVFRDLLREAGIEGVPENQRSGGSRLAFIRGLSEDEKGRLAVALVARDRAQRETPEPVSA